MVVGEVCENSISHAASESSSCCSACSGASWFLIGNSGMDAIVAAV